MTQAYAAAEQAAAQGEVPVGAVLVHEQKAIALTHNQPIAQHNPCAHAEILALQQGGQVLKNYRLLNTTLYVTLEPCTMCLGALMHARVKRLVFGAYDPKVGAICSASSLLTTVPFNHTLDWTGGVQADACGQLLSTFFHARRS